MNKKSTRRCFQCNSLLILVSQETSQLDGSIFSQTNTIYRCTNEECQKQKDKEKAKRMEQLQKKNNTDQNRIEIIKMKREESRKRKTV